MVMHHFLLMCTVSLMKMLMQGNTLLSFWFMVTKWFCSPGLTFQLHHLQRLSSFLRYVLLYYCCWVPWNELFFAGWLLLRKRKASSEERYVCTHIIFWNTVQLRFWIFWSCVCIFCNCVCVFQRCICNGKAEL